MDYGIGAGQEKQQQHQARFSTSSQNDGASPGLESSFSTTSSKQRPSTTFLAVRATIAPFPDPNEQRQHRRARAVVAGCFGTVGEDETDLRGTLLSTAPDQPPSSGAGPQHSATLQLTVPGALISPAHGLMRGHGTQLDEQNPDQLASSLAGAIIQTNKLVRVRPVKSRYQGEIGDVVVGRIVDVQQRRWRVDIGSTANAVLQLISVNLPGGELRRKSIEDELAMREYLREGDLVSAEVQQLFQDGSLSLHTRNLKYGKLAQGQLVRVPAFLVRRRKAHMHNLLSIGVSLILGCNGYIWIAPLVPTTSEADGLDDEAIGAAREQQKTAEDGQQNRSGTLAAGGYLADFEPVPMDTRLAIARTANCVRVLARASIPLIDTTIIRAVRASENFAVTELLQSEVADEVVQDVIAQCTADSGPTTGPSSAANDQHSLQQQRQTWPPGLGVVSGSAGADEDQHLIVLDDDVADNGSCPAAARAANANDVVTLDDDGDDDA